MQDVSIKNDNILTADIMEKVLLAGDLSSLTPAERIKYYMSVCKSLDLNPLTKPFDYLQMVNKKTGVSVTALYPNKGCLEQVRGLKSISVTGIERSIENGVLITTVHVCDKDGRIDIATSAVNVAISETAIMKGEDLAIAIMKGETKAKRRATLSISGLGLKDEIDSDEAQDIDNNTPILNNNIAQDILEKNVLAIENASNADDLKNVFADGYKTLKAMNSRPGAKEALNELNKVYLSKKEELSKVMEAKDEPVI